MKTRRKFIKNSVGLVAGMGALPSLTLQGSTPVVQKDPTDRLPLMMQEKSTRLAFFDPAEGAVPNPGRCNGRLRERTGRIISSSKCRSHPTDQ